jgi:hypothetical protein
MTPSEMQTKQAEVHTGNLKAETNAISLLLSK